MRLCAYVVTRDFGFAPNPFFGLCTLATCKPKIRHSAKPGDWIAGIGSVPKRLGGRLIYAMKVAERIPFEQYWSDPRFSRKRAYLSGSQKTWYGDNIYHPDEDGNWVQEDSHHSLEGGVANPLNSDRDLSVNQVLIGLPYYYFGSECPEVPAQFSEIGRARRGHKWAFPEELVVEFIEWLEATYSPGIHGLPSDWP